MTLRGADLRLVLPHPVERAIFLTRSDERVDRLRLGFEAAGVQAHLGRPNSAPGTADLVVAAAHDAVRALGVPARTHLLLGRARTGALPHSGHHRVPLLIRGAVTRPVTVVPVNAPSALRYYLTRVSAPPSLAARLRNRVLADVSRTSLRLDRVMPSAALVTMVTRSNESISVPAVMQAAHRLGVPLGTQWVLALGTGDDLQRAAFHVLTEGRRRWVLKVARVPAAAASLARDEAGLALVTSLGGAAADHAPTHLGCFEVAGLTGSVETAAPGRPLLELLGSRPLPLIDRVCTWIVALGTTTAAPASALDHERHRLEQSVLPAWRRFGAPADLVQRVPSVPGVLQHNDLGSWNVVTDGQAFMAIDWESARPVGMPLWDLCYFLADVLPRLEGPADPDIYLHRALALFAGHSPHSSILFRWVGAAVRALQVPPSAVGSLVTLCWLHHGLSAGARARSLGDSAAAPLGHLGLLGSHWLADPALGPSWSAWTSG